ncbi:MAG: pseudouridine synthase [Bacillus subtilis]|nr:pseudouridine synthase [Bacillus subtilis]
MVASKTLRGARAFSSALQDRALDKRYLAVLRGRLDRKDHWVDSLERLSKQRRTIRSSLSAHRKAVTLVEPIAANGSFTLADIRILTGLTHQIRARGRPAGTPPLCGGREIRRGDRSSGIHPPCLPLGFPLDFDADAPPTVTAPVPEDTALLVSGSVSDRKSLLPAPRA